jgi:nitrite reductase/ring-hydroxylating ferredoxin subunit
MVETIGWVPVALSSSIEPGTSAGAVIDGAEVVVWRDSKGDAHVWEDRCPHRGMRMSFGFVRGDHIACLYHGWQYDSAGQCQHIPAHPDLEVPKTIKIPTYATEERNGIIWTSLPAEVDIAGIPEVAGIATPVRSLYVYCALSTAHDLLATASLPSRAGGDQPAKFASILNASWTLTSDDTSLLIAGQSIGPGKSALHIVLIGADEASAAQKIAIALWAERLRLSLESAAADRNVSTNTRVEYA